MKKLKALFEYIKLRLITKTPAFFKKLSYLFVVIFITGATLAYYKEHFRESLRDLPGDLIMIGVVGYILCMLPTKSLTLSKDSIIDALNSYKQEGKKYNE